MSIRRPVVEVIDQSLVEILKKQAPEARLKIAAGMWETARVMVRGTLSQEHPEWSEATLNREVAKRLCHQEVRHLYE
ncbi:hypothetical protein [uncultured Gimesia sp.]|jgi:hypothetical protein|uniref:hypothetical protein n=1 Tax=uncultured Gimesia sp. TaxID=1678688 RepID=UPI00261E794D|nr:hypothetical protein [uncultured Gimesia sp.]